jgi:hypothetical protein
MIDLGHLMSDTPRCCRWAGKGEVRVLLAVAALAVLGWYLLSPSPPTEKQPAAAEHPVAPESAGNGAGHEAAADSGRGDLARAVIEELRRQERPDLSQIHERAERFHSVGLLADAYLLYFYAARQGHAPSALALGGMYDPETFGRKPSVLAQPDPAQAHKWYVAAANAGDPVGKRRLAELRARVERAAAKGDSDAGRLMLQWR